LYKLQLRTFGARELFWWQRDFTKPRSISHRTYCHLVVEVVVVVMVVVVVVVVVLIIEGEY